jgi:hypothetical protein
MSMCALLFGAADAQAKANRFLKKAKKAYENLDYTRVTPLLTRALKVAKTDKEKVEIFYLLGTMHTIYSRDRQATEAFTEVLKMDPNFELPPDTSPKIRAAFADARQAVPAGDPVEDPPPDPEPPDGETIDATPVDDGDELPAGVFGPTDDVMPGLTRRSRGSAWYKKWWVWTIAGVVVAGGVGYLTYSLNQVEYPDHSHGPIPLR